MSEPALSGARRRLVDLLKREGPVTAAALAERLDLTDVAVRQHLQGLEAAGLASSRPAAVRGRGRPAQAWSLTESAAALFPDRHGELTVGLLRALRDAFGEEGLERVVQQRSLQQTQHYADRLPRGTASRPASLRARVQALADLRTEEGYLAEVVAEKPGTYLLIEHHCPICDAAKCCLRLCGAELEVFREALGRDVSVERTAHLLSGDDRCVYRIGKTQGRRGLTE